VRCFFGEDDGEEGFFAVRVVKQWEKVTRHLLFQGSELSPLALFAFPLFFFFLVFGGVKP